MNKPTGSWFGPKTEKCVFEKWAVPVLVDGTPRAVGDDMSSRIERTRTRESAVERVKNTMEVIYSKAMEDLSYLPEQFQFEVDHAKGGEGRSRHSSEERGIRGSLGKTGFFNAS